MTQLPQISVVTPSYNQARYIEATILSILNQNYPDLQYIIVDGGSTDGSQDIIRKYASRLAWWTSEPDHGQADAINKGMDRASGTILAFLNSDDCYKPGTLIRIGEMFAADPDLDFLYGDTEFIDANGASLYIHKEIAFDFLMGSFFGFGPIMPQPSTFWRKAVWNECGQFDASLNFNLDGDFFSRAVVGRTVKHIPYVLSQSRFHESSKTVSGYQSHDSRQHDEHLAEVTRSYNRLSIAKIIPFQYSKPIRWAYRSKRVLKRLLRGHYLGGYRYHHVRI